MRVVLKTQDRKQERSDFAWTMAQVCNSSGAPLRIADISSVNLFVYDKTSTTPGVSIYSTGITVPLTGVGGCFSDVLRRNGDTPPTGQPAVPWTENNVGCNFAHYLYQALVFPGGPTDPVEAGGHTYRLEYRITTVAAGTIWVIRESTTSGVTSGGGGGGPPPPNVDFALAITGASSETLQVGTQTSFDFGVSPINGFTGDVTMTVTVDPAMPGTTFTFVPPVVPGGAGSTTLTVATVPSTAPDHYTATITGTSGTLVHQTSVQMNVVSGGGGSTGWTTFVPITDAQDSGHATRIVYCSNSVGSDTFDGTTPDPVPATSHGPFKTIGHARQSLRDGLPDWLLLRCGDTWNESFDTGGAWQISGRLNGSVVEPMLLSSYSTLASGTVRPIMNCGTHNGFSANAGGPDGNHGPVCNYIAIVGLHFISDGNLDGGLDVVGIQWFSRGSTYTLIEDCCIEQFEDNIIVSRIGDPAGGEGSPARTTPDATWVSGVLVRRNVILDAHVNATSSLFVGHGMYCAWVNGIVVEENVWEHCGWRADMRGSYQAFNKHTMYMQNSIHNATVRGNVYTETDIQMRGGGIFQDNLMLNNYIGFQLGLGSSTGDDPLGIIGNVTGNVQLGGSNVGDQRMITQARWDEPSLTLTVLQPPNPWAGLVNNAMVGFSENLYTTTTATWTNSSLTLAFPGTPFPGSNALAGIHVFVTDGPIGVTPGRYTIASNTTSALVLTASITGGANASGVTAQVATGDGVSMNFHVTSGTGTIPDDPTSLFQGRRITASTANTLTFNRTISARGATGMSDITGWTTYGVAQGDRGIHMYCGNVAGATITGNICAQQTTGGGLRQPGHRADVYDLSDGLQGEPGGGAPGSPIGCNAMIFTRNKSYNWAADQNTPGTLPFTTWSGFFLRAEKDNSLSPTRYTGNVFDSNEHTNFLTTQAIVHYEFANDHTGFAGLNNHFWTQAADPPAGGTSWAELPTQSSFAAWKASMVPADTTSSAQAASYSIPNASIATYMTSIGGGSTYADYIREIRTLSRQNTLPARWSQLMPTSGAGNTALGPLAYFRAAFS